MKVFSTYYKIVKRNILGIGLYLMIFLVIIILMTLQNRENKSDDFQEVKIDMTVINQDGESPVVNGLIAYLEDYVNFIEIENEKEKLQDALFFRETEYIAKIPEGFYNDFLKNGNLQIEKMGVEDSYSNIYMDTLINKYLNTWNIYKDLLPELSEETILEYVKEDIQKEISVELNNKNLSDNENSFMIYFFNMAPYSLLGILIAGITKVMASFLQKDIKQRNQSSPVKSGVFNGKIVLGNCMFSMIIFAIHVIAVILLFKEAVFTTTGLFMTINMLIFTLNALSLGILVSTFVKNKNAQTAAANTISLGMCFISGAFVPQELLGNTVKQIASFTPAYWYIKGNTEISQLTSFTFSSLETVFYSMGIQLGFAIAIISVTLFLTRQRALKTA